jgi:hypothetical protein
MNRASRRARREAAAFACGSACFAVAAVPAVVDAVGVIATNAAFFLGSVLFTTGAALQLAAAGGTRAVPGRRGSRLEWWASAVQLLGTLFFNASTLVALAAAVPGGAAGGTGWRPDAYGSACFLIASALGVRAAAVGADRVEAWLNLVGSVFFGVAAVGAFVLPGTTALLSPTWTAAGTFIGAVLFFAAAVPGLAQRGPSVATRRPGRG